VKRIALFTLALIVAACAATSARATGPITIVRATTNANRQVFLRWQGPYLSYGTVYLATSPHRNPDGHLSNVIEDDLFDAGDDNWTFIDPVRPGTYWVQVEGRDDMCHSYDRGNGLIGWIGCDTLSDIAKVTVKPICKKKLIHRGYYTYRNGRRIWHKPVYKTICK